MSTVKLKYVNAFVDRHGKPRAYFRFGGEAWKLPMPEGSAEFMTKYSEYLLRATSPGVLPTAPTSADVLNMKHSVAWVIQRYRAHDEFKRKAPGTRLVYGGTLDYLQRKFGNA